MKILFCNFEYPPLGGGGGVINALVAEELAKNHDVTVLTSRVDNLPFERDENGVRVIRVPVMLRHKKAVASMASMVSYVGMGLKKGLDLLKNEEFDVINTHFVLPTGPVGDLLSRVGKIPNVLSLHGGDLYDPSKFLSPHRHAPLRWSVRNLLNAAEIVVGQSRNTLENMRKYYTPELEGIRIPLAIKRPKPIDSRREDFGLKEDEVILTTIGRLVPRKAFDQLVKMMGSFRGENVRLLIIGSGPEEAELKRLVEKEGVQSQVNFMGFVSEEDKYRLLNVSDLFVSTSQHEGFGIVYLEAMACGLPVICYDEGGQTDFLDDGKTGFMVPLNNLERFAARCRQVIRDEQFRTEVRAHNFQLVEDYFIDRCALKYENIFNEAIELYASREHALFARQGTG